MMIVRISKEDLHYAPIYIMLLGYVTILCGEPLNLKGFVSIGTWLIVLATLYILIADIVLVKKAENTVLVLFCLIACVALSVIAETEISYSVLVSIGCFLEIPIFFCAYNKTSEKIKNSVCISHFLLSIFYIFISITPLAYMYENKWGKGRIADLTLSYGNPNEASMYLFTSIVVLTIYIQRIKNKYFKIAIIILDIALYRLVFLTKSRTMILISIIFAVFCFLYRTKKIPSMLRKIFFVIPFLFILIVVYYKEFGADILFLGETFDTGRSEIYNDLFDDLKLWNYIYGDFSYRFTNLHNAALSIFGTIGLGGTFWYYVLMSCKLKTIQVNINDSVTKKFAFIGLLCIVLHTSTEAAFLTAGSAFAMSMISLYILCLHTEESKCDIKRKGI